MSAAKATASALPVDDKRRAHEPTMEEILASIRRIISDDQISRSEEVDSRPEAPLGTEATAETLHPPVREMTPGLSKASDTGECDESSLPHVDEDQQEHILRHLKASSEAQSRGAFRQAAEILEAAERGLLPLDPPRADTRSAPEIPVHAPEIDPHAPLVSSMTAAAIAAQFESLAASRLFGEDGRMDELVKQLLRPMLQEWLEDNLPGIVEKLVRAEIERVARGGRS